MKIRKDINPQERGFKTVNEINDFLKGSFFKNWNVEAQDEFIEWCTGKEKIIIEEVTENVAETLEEVTEEITEEVVEEVVEEVAEEVTEKVEEVTEKIKEKK